MTYEQFKLAIFNMAASGPSFFPAVNAALRTVWNRENAGASAEELIRLAYNEYCRTHGITE